MGRAILNTVTLPSLTVPQSVAARLATATDVPYRVTVRVISPVASWAIMAYSPNDLDIPTLGVLPVGETAIIPVGEFQRFRLAPRQALFAKGSAPNVVVSVISSEIIDEYGGDDI